MAANHRIQVWRRGQDNARNLKMAKKDVLSDFECGMVGPNGQQ